MTLDNRYLSYDAIDGYHIRRLLRQHGSVGLVLTEEQASVALYLIKQASRLNDRISLFSGIVAMCSFLKNIKLVWMLHRNFRRLADIESVYLEEKGLGHTVERRASGDVVLRLETRKERS